MIKTKDELKGIIKYEKRIYLSNEKRHLKMMIIHDHDYLVWKFVYALRKLEYYQNNGKKLYSFFWERKKNILGRKCGIYAGANSIDKGLRIWHYGDIIIHKNAKIGKNCQLHGMNCIGNKGIAESGVPVIGNNVNIGVGAKIIGGIYIAHNVTIAANAVVTKSCYQEGAVLAGVPAKIVR